MKCPICRHGDTAPAKVTITLERRGTTLVFRSVPADVCQNCGEEYVDEQTTARLLSQARDAVNAGVEIEVRAYAAV